MDGRDFYEELLKRDWAIKYMKKLEAAVPSGALINIRTNYLMTCIATISSHNLTSDAGLSKNNLAQADNRLSPQTVNTEIQEPVGSNVDNDEVLSEKCAESDDDDLDLPEEVKFEIVSDSEPEELSNENLSGEEPISKRICRMNETSMSGIPPEIEEPTTDISPIEKEKSSAEILINNAVIMENIFKHLPWADLLKFRTVSTDWNKKIISHMDKNDMLMNLNLEILSIGKFISIVQSSKQMPFTKFNVAMHFLLKINIQQLLTICGSSIKHLTIRVSDFTEKFSQFLPNLESLHLDADLPSNSQKEFSDEEDGINAPILFSKLTDIKYTLKKGVAVRMFPKFSKSTPNLNRLEVRNAHPGFEKHILEDLITAGWLVNVTKLHLNTLGESTFQTLFNAASTTGLFLEEFCVNKIDKWIELDDFTVFLSTQGETLKKLEIKTTFKPPLVIKHPKEYKTKRKLAVFYDSQKKLHTFQELKLKNMVALTSLSFRIANDGIHPLTENTLEDVPNLVEVTIPEISASITDSAFLQFCCSTVTKLVVKNIVPEKKYSDKREYEQNIIKSLGIMFPSVKSLELGDASPEFVQIVTTVWPALKHLAFSAGYKTRSISNMDEIHSVLPSLAKLNDLETLSIFDWNWGSTSLELRVFVRFEKNNPSSMPAKWSNRRLRYRQGKFVTIPKERQKRDRYEWGILGIRKF